MSPKSKSKSKEQQQQQLSSSLDLTVIDEAFGDFADLYSDVLRVSVAATSEQIQMAYFDRRSELFTLLAKMDSRPQQQQDDEATLHERIMAERKMDSVVLAVRILGDAEQRLAYDRMRQRRLLNRRRAEHGQLPGHKARVGAGLDASNMEEHGEEPITSQHTRKLSLPNAFRRDRKKKPKKHRDSPAEEPAPRPTPPRSSKLSAASPTRSLAGSTSARSRNSQQQRALDAIVEPEVDDEAEDDEEVRAVSTTDTDEFRQDDGDTTVYSMVSVDKTPKKSGYLSCITNSRIMRKISDEISGACEDTLVSVDQVFNAFTLTDKDIKAVTKRIDRAKRQLDG